MKILQLEQNQSLWHLWRNKGLGASDAPAILNRSPWTTRGELKEKKLKEMRKARRRKGRGLPDPDNGAMRRGRMLEPVARDLYTDMTGIRTRPVCVVHDDLTWMRASLDGLDEANLIPLEIKCVNHSDHEKALSGEVPFHYYPQVQHQLHVTGLSILHYFSYTDKPYFRPRDRVALVEVGPDRAFIDNLVQEEKRFWEELQEELKDPEWLSESEN